MKKISKNKVSFRGLYKWVIHSFLSRNIGKNVDWKDKIEFEKDILRLLEKYDLFKRNKKNVLEKVVITVVTEGYPKVDLSLINLKNDAKPID